MMARGFLQETGHVAKQMLWQQHTGSFTPGQKVSSLNAKEADVFGRKLMNRLRPADRAHLSKQVFSNVLIEALEDRRLLSASVHHVHPAATHAAKHHAATTASLKSTASKAGTTSTSSSSCRSHTR